MEAIVGAPLRSRAWGMMSTRDTREERRREKPPGQTAERKDVEESPHTYEYGKG
jgi:hypothetical protein